MSEPSPEPTDIEWLVPRRDWKLGQSDKTTAGCLWALVLGCVLYGFAVLIIALAMASGPAPPGMFTMVVLWPVALALFVIVGFVRLMSTGRWAGYGRLAARLRRAHSTWARVRLKEPPMRVFGLPVLWGRGGLCFVAPDRVVLLVRRVHPLLAGLALALNIQGVPQLVGGGLVNPAVATAIATAALLVAVALFLLSGVDVHEIRFTQIERVDAGDGHVTWTQNGPDAPRVLRLRVTHPDDAAMSSRWLSGDDAPRAPE